VEEGKGEKATWPPGGLKVGKRRVFTDRKRGERETSKHVSYPWGERTTKKK